jgi:2-polyprenyl-6-methoxyphenol hydroxylase-like FAD-dependent oxidoreductase
LCAARVLSDHYSRVTLIERDALGETASARKGVPQGAHSHGLLISGGRALERMFPGLRGALVERGAVVSDVGQARYCISGVRLAAIESDLHALRMSRPLLESYVRERVRALPNVVVLDDSDVFGLTVVDDAVRGVRIIRRHLRVEQWLPADLVVDATGRGSKLPRWLRDLGFEAAAEERVRIDVGYTSCTYRVRPEVAAGRAVVLVGVAAPNTRCGIGMAIEGDRWMVSIGGYLGDYAPLDPNGLLVFARGMPNPDLYEILRGAEPLSKPVQARFPYSQRRRYERLRKFPRGILAIGDALCSFNPMYGQGMSVAALEAEYLGECLNAFRGDDLRREFFAGCSQIIDTPWKTAVGGDLRFERVEGARPLAARLRNLYLRRLLRAAGDEPECALAWLSVANLVKPPASLFAPNILRRVIAHGRASRAKLKQLTALANATDSM